MKQVSAPGDLLLRSSHSSALLQILLLNFHRLNINGNIGDSGSTLVHLQVLHPGLLVHVVDDGGKHSVLRRVSSVEVLHRSAPHPHFFLVSVLVLVPPLVVLVALEVDL